MTKKALLPIQDEETAAPLKTHQLCKEISAT